MESLVENDEQGVFHQVIALNYSGVTEGLDDLPNENRL